MVVQVEQTEKKSASRNSKNITTRESLSYSATQQRKIQIFQNGTYYFH